uniref:ODAD1 central coiled coil region domain-containing protein n=2 Tax=Hemiselmis andersenii TaxID=464988 RepID=A0A6U2FT42_HEMAN|mmetsp:Transcript_33812/g.79206  ORF Transcript_33812/g.79206 Transcript_33812/m.79206 type:complete len:629 (+) Transcript_33812:164-2050(+)
MSTFLTSLPDHISVDPNPEEEKALQHLRKVVKLLDKENEQFRRDCDNKMSYQKKQEDRLREENERLRIKVNDVSRPKVSVLAEMEERQSQLNQQVEVYHAKIELDERRMDDLEKAMEDTSSRIADNLNRIRAKTKAPDFSPEELQGMGYRLVKGEGSTHSHWVGPDGEKFRSKNDVCRAMAYIPDIKVKKKLSMLEDRVQQTLQRFNESLVVNKELRAEIEHLRKERVSFDHIHAKLESGLQQRKAEIAQAIEASNVALETREEATKKMAFYKGELLKNQQEFDAEWRALDAEMDSEEKRRRQVKARMEEEAKKAKGSEDELAHKAQLQELTAKYEASKADVERFEEAFAKLQEATGLKDINELVETFLEAEEQNFKLYKFVNELNHEEEQISEEVHRIQVELERMSDAEGVKVMQEMNAKLSQQLAQMSAKTAEYAEMEQEEDNKLKEILKMIQRMYEELGCSRLVNTQDLFQCDANGAPLMSEGNMMTFLGVVEQRSTEMILKKISDQAAAVDEPKELGDLRITTASPLGLGPATPVGASLVKVQAPKIETEDKSGDEKSDEEGDDDDDSRPMTQEELRIKMKKKLTQAVPPGKSMFAKSKKGGQGSRGSQPHRGMQPSGAVTGGA